MKYDLKDVLHAVAEELAKRIDAVFDSLFVLRGPVLDLLSDPELQSTELEQLQPLARDLIEQHGGLVTGAGVAVAPGTLKNAQTWMQSWHDRDDELRITQHSLNPESIHFYDYANMPWYQLTAESFLPMLIGPYMDFGGTDTRVITASVPAVYQSRVLGTVVADLSLERLEHLLLTKIKTVDSSVTLINDGGKVIATNSAEILVSGSVPDAHHTEVVCPARCPDCGWRLLLTKV